MNTEIKKQLEKINQLKILIGNTPLIAIHFEYKHQRRRIFAKCENYNLTGSIKDRMALFILKNAYENNKIKIGDKIVEATSGNTGISFSALGKILGHEVLIFMPDWMSRERIDLIQSLGAEVVLVSKQQGGFLGSIKMTVELAEKEKNIFLPSQFSNYANIEAHRITTGPEIWEQLLSKNIMPDAFVAGVGTGGTVMGVGKFLKSQNNRIKVFPLEPAESPTLSTGYKVGQHRIQGISDEFIPEICKLNYLDEIIAVHDGDAIIMAKKLANELGLAVGISSGANFIGAVKIQNLLGNDANVVTVFADDNKKYLSTSLVSKEPAKDYYLSTNIKLLEFETINRVCSLCNENGSI